MEKNSFLIFNDILYELYSCPSVSDLGERFLPHLKMLIPFSYASILTTAQEPSSCAIRLVSPVCFPEFFREAEEEYLRFADEDHLLWLIHRRESALIRESDLLPEEQRRSTPLYLHCYEKYDIYDTLQYSIVYQQKTLGVLTLFRTRIDGTFSDEDLFYLRSLGTHLNLVMHRFFAADTQPTSSALSAGTAAHDYGLTSRETQLLHLLLALGSTEEICAEMQIRENTLQKHTQNLFRKLGVSSRWELLRLFSDAHRHK